MDVRLSHSFAERIRGFDPEHEDLLEAPLMFVVSSQGVAVEKFVADSWAKGTFVSPLIRSNAISRNMAAADASAVRAGCIVVLSGTKN
jgi:hypothetical protein